MKRVAVAVLALALLMLILASSFVVAVPVQASSTKIFTVSPSGGDDTANIQDAFDAAMSSGPGSTVQLTAGQFYTNGIFVENFIGSFKGAGKDATKIDVLRGLDPNAPGVESTASGLFVFKGGDIRVSDLTFDITPFAPSEDWILGGGPYQDLIAIVYVTGSTVNSAFERVVFKGHEGTFLEEWSTILGTSWNVRMGVYISGSQDWAVDPVEAFSKPTTGVHTISDSSFDHLAHGVYVWGLTNGELKVGGSASAENTFVDCCIGVDNTDTVNSIAEISYNKISRVRMYGVIIEQLSKPRASAEPFEAIPSASQWLISHNTIQAIIFADGVGLEDRGPLLGVGKTLNAVISANTIILGDTSFSGIAAGDEFSFGAQDVVVLNNRISGSGLSGICMGVFGDVSAGWVLVGNNVQNVNAFVAPIWLGPGSSGCTVVGGSTKRNVLDEGINNRIVGVNNMKGNPPGPAIKNAMELKRTILNPPP